MNWDKALAEMLLEEPEIRSWLGLDPRPRDPSADSPAKPPRLGSVDRPALTGAHGAHRGIAA